MHFIFYLIQIAKVTYELEYCPFPPTDANELHEFVRKLTVNFAGYNVLCENCFKCSV